MASSFTVGDVYGTVAGTLLEPYAAGLAPGLSLGIVTQAQFLQIFGTILIDFLNRTGNVWEICTQQLQFGTTRYLYPTEVSTVEQVFVGGVDVEHVALQDLDNWNSNWTASYGTPEFWHQDGMPPKTIEVSPNPNYTGAGYVLTPGDDPPINIFGKINQAPITTWRGTANVFGTGVYWQSGDLFDSAWDGYSPTLNIVLNGVASQMASVTSPTELQLISAPGNAVANWSVSVGSDGNLTVMGPKSIDSTTFTLAQVIPVLPDSFCIYLAFGVLAKIFSMDGECKDQQRAAYCAARYMEGISLCAAVAGNLV